MLKELNKQYDPAAVEDRIYKMWEDGGYFHAEVDEDKKPYAIVMPPPNITGQLHMGHALDNTLQDTIIRFKRMQGYSALWLPGTDHAAIATEVKIVEAMRKEGITKDDIGREAFLDRAWKWKEKFGGTIVKQLRKMGSSCDWARERFTMDEGCSKAVLEVFNTLYEKGLIYRGERIINWCPSCKTTISDAEVVFEEQQGNFWHLRYPLSDGSGYIELATTRPETMLGDTAVAVHPHDERYQHLVGKTVILPIVGREIPIIADRYVERDFGTGVVKITPAHDPNDYEVGLRHELPVINVMNDDGSINENGGKYCGMAGLEARKAIVEELEKEGFLIKVEPLTHNVGTCYRCHSVIEPRVSKQWFVKMEPLAKPAIKAVRNGSIKYIPDRFSKIYINWMENLRDWCISRQIWWGHRIPAWYCDSCGKIHVSRTPLDKCPDCGAPVHQDPDTLDTWFSSALWPFSTLGWPEKTKELEYFYPTDVLVTGYDIITFWVSRMIFSALEFTGEKPFGKVFIHGIVRDANGLKMSKSLGNGIDPLEVIKQYGADSLRLSLLTGVSPGSDMRYIEKKVESCRNFANKLWNASRYVLMNLQEDDVGAIPRKLELEDKWILGELNRTIGEMTNALNKFELGIAVQKIYDFTWDYFCDWYIELSKVRLNAGGTTAKNARSMLLYVLTNILKLLHPFMPFITEELYQTIPHDGEALIAESWPVKNSRRLYKEESEEMRRIMAAIKAVRLRRSEMNVPPSKKAEMYIETSYRETFEHGSAFIMRLASASSIEIGESFDIPGAVSVVADGAKILIPMDQLVDKEKELERLNKELEKVESDIAKTNAKLSNQGFVAKAPANVVEAEKAKLEKAKERKAIIEASIAQFK